MNLISRFSQQKSTKGQIVLFAVIIFVVSSVAALIVGLVAQSAYLAIMVFIVISIGYIAYLFRKSEQEKTVEEKAKEHKLSLRALYVTILIYVAISSLIFFNERIKNNVQTNTCLNQDSNKSDEQIVKDVINQFEIFQNRKDVKSITTCLADPQDVLLKDTMSLFSYQITKMSQIDSQSFLSEVRENYSQYVDGIGGGSLRELLMVGHFTLKKNNNRWQIEYYYRSPDISNKVLPKRD